VSDPPHYYNPYEWLARVYDPMARLMLLPFGGEDRVRTQALSALELKTPLTVLELGCGTGAMTKRMLGMGASVTAIDLSEAMLVRARRRAPGARFIRGDILKPPVSEAYDRVLLSFVLHEMDAATRGRALAVARSAITDDGRVGVLDYVDEAPWPISRALRAYLRIGEPEMARELLDRERIPRELRDAGLRVGHTQYLAAGTAQMLVAEPS